MLRALWMPTAHFRQAHVVRETRALPRGGARLVFVTDIHMRPAFREKQMGYLCDQLASLRPDLLLFGGDMGESDAYIMKCLSMLSQVPAPLGRAGVLGNNDRYFLGDRAFQAVEEAESMGVALLVNRAARFGGFTVAGLDDMRWGDPEYRDYFADARDQSRILLSHYPNIVAPAVDAMTVKPHLALCGHTHGGQFRLGPLTPYSFGYERRFSPLPAVYGWGESRGVPVLVSNGIGASRIPLRVGAEPQIHVLEIVNL